MNLSFSAVLKFIGRLHVLLVHLPIGFLILLGAVETAALFPRFKHVTASSRFTLVLTALAAAPTILCGWLLSRSGDYDAQLLFWHKWLGISLGIAAVILLFLHWRGWVKTYRVALCATLVLLAVTGHFGGSLTHGTDYLTFIFMSAKPQKSANAAPPNNGSFYSIAIQPIFNQNCIACHGPHKSKAKLRLDTAENMFHGGDSGPVLVPGESGQSLMIKRLRLPPDDDDHMPPDGKRQPTPAQIRLLQWWIDSGASTDETPQELNPPADILRLLPAKNDTSP